MPFPRFRSSAPAHRAPRRRFLGHTRVASFAAALVSVVALVAGGLVMPSLTNAAEMDATVEVIKSIEGETGVPEYSPGDDFVYELKVSCSSTVSDFCQEASLSDAVPAPLVVQSVSVVGLQTGYYADRSSGNSVLIDFTRQNAEGDSGLVSGTSGLTILVSVRIPADVSADFAGVISNTAHMTANNAPADQSTADATLNVSKTLDVAVSKSAKPTAALPAAPGLPVEFTIGAANKSNHSVDSLTLTDPGAGSTNFGYLDFTGVSSIAGPTGADTVLIEWLDDAGDWQTLAAAGPIPGDTSALFDGVDLATVKGTRFTFTSSSGKLPVTPADGAAAIVLGYATNDDVKALAPNVPLTITNVVDATVTDEGASATKQAPATVAVLNTPPSVTVEKSFARTAIMPGSSTTATLRATSTGKTVTTMTVAEPGASGLTLAEQGLNFDGFVAADIEWPAGASTAEITYLYADGSSSAPLATSTTDSLPASPAGTVVGFSVTFTGSMDQGEYAVMPFGVTAQPLPADALVDVTATNIVDAEVVDAEGQSADDSAAADLARQVKRVNTEISKNIVKGELWGTPGSSTLISLPSKVTPDDGTATGSTIGAESLVVSDPAVAVAGDAPTAFWNNFDLKEITAVDVPVSATMTPEYWDGSTWKTLPGVFPLPVPAGTSGWSYTPSAALKEQLQGIRFVFEPAVAGKLLEPGFNVLPYFKVALRDQLRDGSGSTRPIGVPVTIENEASSTASNPNAVVPVVTDTATDAIVLKPFGNDGVGPNHGPDLVEKAWDKDELIAQSDDTSTVRLSWGTQDFPFDTITVTDPASVGELGSVVTSVYDAFNVTRINPMTDQWMKFDKVVAERYSDASDTWVPLGVCTAAAPCVGSFPGYDFTEAEQLDTLGVRFTFAERADRATVIRAMDDPEVGSGVAASTGRSRTIDLVMQLRTHLRSTPTTAVLGDTHGSMYNSTDPATVVNTVDATGVSGSYTHSSTDDDEIVIIDEPLNVSIAKRFVDYDENEPDRSKQPDIALVGLPQAGTDPSRYPLVTALLTATNDTASKVNALRISDPNPSATAADTFYENFNLFRIVGITQPAGTTTTTVTLKHAVGPDTVLTSLVAVYGQTSSALANVTGVVVQHDGRIASGAGSDLRFEYQLRELTRTGGTPVSKTDLVPPHVNTALAELESPAVDPTAPPVAEAFDDMAIAAPVFGLESSKSISPAERYEDESRANYTVALTGKPTGTVRTTTVQLDDATPTFWNAFDFVAFKNITLKKPVEQVRVSVLLGTDFTASAGALNATCAGNAVLDACWRTADRWVVPAGQTITAAQLTASFDTPFTAANVRGVRFEFQRADGAGWERPSNPTASASYGVERRTTLRVDVNNATDTLVPTTRNGLTPAPGETTSGQISNVLKASATGAWNNDAGNVWTAASTANAQTLLKHRVNAISVSKVHGREDRTTPDTKLGTFLPGQEIPYVIDIVNKGAWPMTGLALTDQLTVDGAGSLLVEPTQEPDETPVSPYTFVLKNGAGAVQSSTGFAAALNATTGKLTITVPTGFVFAPGASLKITAKLTLRTTPFVTPGTQVTNAITAVSDRAFDTCDFSKNGTWRTQVSNAASCSSETTLTPAASSPLKVVKSVKGEGAGLAGRDDLGVLALKVATSYCENPNAANGYYTTPCVPITVPGGSERWRMQLTNSGNIDAVTLTGIDVLPGVGDEGVTVSGPRGSLWTPSYLGDMQAELGGLSDSAKAVVTTYYADRVPSRICNEADITSSGGTALAPDDPCAAEIADRNATLWKVYDNSLPAATLKSVRALKFVVTFTDGGAVRPGETIGFNFLTQTAWYAARAEAAAQGVDPIAWNVVSAASVGKDNSKLVQSTVTQPRRVGVAMASGQIELSKLVVGAQSSWGAPFPTDYPFQLACTSGGVNVPLLGTNGTTDLSRFRLKADGTVLNFNGGTGVQGNVTLPLNAVCTLTEVPAGQGVVVSYSSPTATALRSSFSANVANPAHTGTVVLQEIVATNTYQPAGFSVTKTVDNGGAENQAAEDIVYAGPFGFSASCRFLGATVLSETFSLGVDGVKSFTDLPAGATCTVTETGTGGSASSNSVFTQTGQSAVATDGRSASFTLTPDNANDELTNELVMENVFTVGAATITKELAGNGSGAWGNESFTVGLSCTLATATPQTVFTGTKVLSKTAPVWNVAGLPSGANCTVSESKTGGANGTAFSPTSFTVGASASTPTAVTVTNTFTTGTLNVVKLLAGAPAASLAPAIDDEYTIELSCTRDVDGVSQSIAIPGGAERTLTVADPVAYNGLPTGAECTVSETGLGHAQSSSISPNGGVVVVGDNTSPVEVEITNTFENGSLEISKAVTGAGSSFAPSTFDATVSCSWQGAALTLPNAGVVTLEPGVPATLNDLPLGSVCSVDEADAGQTSWTATPASVTVTDTTDAAEIAVENVYELASLRVEKTVQTGSTVSTLPTRFAFSAQCTFEGAVVLPLTTFTLNAGQHRDFTGLPARSDCTVIETDARGADSTVSSVTVVGATVPPVVDQATSTVEIPELSADAKGELQNTVGFTNLFDSSALVVQKRLEGGAAAVGTDKTFDIAVVCTLPGESPVTTMLALNADNGFSASLGELIVGTECSITEQGLQGADAVVIEPNDGSDLTVGVVTIPNAGSTLVTVSNWYLSGSLAVTKAVVGDAAATFGTGDFSLDLSCTLGGRSIAIAGGSARTVSAANPSALFTGLPTGAECALTETGNGGAGASRITDGAGTTLVGDAAAGYTFTVVTDASVLGAADQPQPELVVENTFNFAAVTATKTVESTIQGADGQPFDHGVFELALSCTLDGKAVSAAEPRLQTLAAGESVSWTQLPERADCEITETDARGAFGTTIVSEQGTTTTAVTGLSLALDPLLAVGGANTVSVVNEFAAASVTLRKVVDGTAADTVKRSFPVAMSCVLVNEQYPAPGLIVRDAVHEIGGSKDLTFTDDALPAGVECTVTETDTGNATKTTVTVGDKVTDGPTASFVIAGGAVGAATVTVTNTFTAPPAGGLSSTGVQAATIAGAAALILGLGALLLIVGRRRRRRASSATGE
ncbi:DUF5979 domain-containing protein [Microterricola viridarii]|uniref:DUF5979 domain-containing protein n=1 Tax=Microterricola viridarii TaxID=412690 RepID=UPI000A92327F|nr:DUF5979 domain-containing protein [Microterricola viridarii]